MEFLFRTRPHVGPNLTCPLLESECESDVSPCQKEIGIPETHLEIYEAAADRINGEVGEPLVELWHTNVEAAGTILPPGYLRLMVACDADKTMNGFLRILGEEKARRELGG